MPHLACMMISARFPHHAILLAGVFLLLAEPVQAACTDIAAPGVNWRRCIQDGNRLDGVDLSKAVLIDGSFKRASLTGAKLADANLRQAKFVSADLADADLSGADLFNTDFTSADLTGVSLNGAKLRRTRLFGAKLRGADLTAAVIDGADFLHADLSGARWVDGKTICAEGSSGQCLPSAEGSPAASVR